MTCKLHTDCDAADKHLEAVKGYMGCIHPGDNDECWLVAPLLDGQKTLDYYQDDILFYVRAGTLWTGEKEADHFALVDFEPGYPTALVTTFRKQEPDKVFSQDFVPPAMVGKFLLTKLGSVMRVTSAGPKITIEARRAIRGMPRIPPGSHGYIEIQGLIYPVCDGYSYVLIDGDHYPIHDGHGAALCRVHMRMRQISRTPVYVASPSRNNAGILIPKLDGGNQVMLDSKPVPAKPQYPGWKPMCMVCSSMNRMQARTYGWQCQDCKNQIGVDLYHLDGAPLVDRRPALNLPPMSRSPLNRPEGTADLSPPRPDRDLSVDPPIAPAEPQVEPQAEIGCARCRARKLTPRGMNEVATISSAGWWWAARSDDSEIRAFCPSCAVAIDAARHVLAHALEAVHDLDVGPWFFADPVPRPPNSAAAPSYLVIQAGTVTPFAELALARELYARSGDQPGAGSMLCAVIAGPGQPMPLTMDGIQHIAAERRRQLSAGFDADHDDEHHDYRGLAVMAASYATPEAFPSLAKAKMDISILDRLRMAGAFCAAAIDAELRRLDKLGGKAG